MSQLSYDDVLQLLSEGKTLVTVNGRLRDKLAWRYGENRLQGHNKSAWIKPRIYTLEEQLSEIWGSYELNDPKLPILLSKEQERALWTKIIQADYPEGFIQLSKIASLAMQAWRNIHLWAMPDYLDQEQSYFQGTDDAKKFNDWAKRFIAELKIHKYITGCERVGYFLTHTEIIDKILEQPSWVLIGFDDFPPIYQQLITRYQLSQVDLHFSNATSAQIAFKRSSDEFETAARWAKNLLEKGMKNIAIIHPELAMHRNTIEETFLEVFHPEHVYCAQKMVSNQFTVSTGTPLGSQALVKTALQLFKMIKSQYKLLDIDFILRQGYIGKNISQSTENFRIIQLIKKTECSLWPIKRLQSWLAQHTESLPILNLFETLKQCQMNQEPIHVPINLLSFVQQLKKCLLIFDFPGERILSSLEHQILDRFYCALESYSTLSLITPDKKYTDMLIDFEVFLNFIPFQAESGEVPVNIMGVLEGSGQLFSHLWVMGMNNQNWPGMPDPNPFLAYDLQREKEMPHASAEREYALSIKISDRLKQSANQVIFSYSQYEEDKLCLPSEFIQSLPMLPLDCIEQSVKTENQLEWGLEKIEDNQAPKVEVSEKVSGGTRILKAQAACPFKAFSEIRLKLNFQYHELSILGINAMERGMIVHDVLDMLWAELKDHHTLFNIISESLDSLVQEKIKNAIEKIREKDRGRLGDKFWKNEQINLSKVIHNWLKLEKERMPFKVLLREAWQKIQLEGLTLNLRVDRIDLTESNETIVIDYKTGEANFANCFGERLNEPQLPIYCLLEKDLKPLGVAFGVVKPTGECNFIGITYSEKVLPRIHSVENQKSLLSKFNIECKLKLEQHSLWQTLIDYWKHNLANLTKEFMSGVALVSPKNGLPTCRNCHLTSLCRIHEKITA